ncbi:MAG: alpha/beta hydrolase [Methylocella sp.]
MTAARERRFSRLPATLLAAAIGATLSLAGCASMEGVAGSVASVGGLLPRSPPGVPSPVLMFVASTRSPGSAAEAGAGDLHYSLDTVTVPPKHEPGVVERPSFGSADSTRDFVVGGSRPLDDDRFVKEITIHLSGRVGASRDILVFVHGFNTSLEEARFRLAQIVADSRFGGVPVLFDWQSHGGILAYGSDKESATASRDALERLLMELAKTPGLGRVHILAHSMGGWLAMEALRENAIAGHTDLGGHLGNVMLAAPDIDLSVFRQQMSRLDGRVRVSVYVSSGDRALSLSSRLAGDRPRLGALDPSDPRDKAELDRLGVRVHDLSAISDGFIDHGAYADAPEVIRSIGAKLAEPRADAGVMSTGGEGFQQLQEAPLTPEAVTASPLAAPTKSSVAAPAAARAAVTP